MARPFAIIGWLLIVMAVPGCGLSVEERTGQEPGWSLPLAPDRSRSFEAAERERPVLEETSVPGRLDLAFSTTPTARAQGPADDPDYATYGSRSVRLDLSSYDLEGYDRIAFRIRPACDGSPVVNLDCWLPCLPANHLISLENNRWNECTLNIGNYPRKGPQELRFTATLRGRDAATGDSCRFRIDSIFLQRTADIPSERGWQPTDIVLSTGGYAASGPKTAILPADCAGRFTLEDRRGRTVFRGEVRAEETTLGRFAVADFSGFTREGEYVLRAGNRASHPFLIGDGRWDSAAWKALSFIFGERCGDAVPSVHGKCHLDLFAHHGDHSRCRRATSPTPCWKRRNASGISIPPSRNASGKRPAGGWTSPSGPASGTDTGPAAWAC